MRTGSETNDHSVGVAFSPNSRFVYLIYRFDLHQVDTWAQDLQANLGTYRFLGWLVWMRNLGGGI
ncbi:MAG: hypothetical protein IPG87_21025 [Saprospiraceae bacterium]|nr:hypothetical protein [Candidatus Vicinibacter affinis]